MRLNKSVLALDPANKTGFALSSGWTGTWDLTKAPNRLVELARLLRNELEQKPVDIIAYEDASFGGINRNTQASHNELAGIIKLIAAERGCEVISYKPSSIKSYACIPQKSPKSASITACERLLQRYPKDDNEADAIWICEMVLNGYQPKKAAKKKRAKGKGPPMLPGIGKYRRIGMPTPKKWGK